VKTILSRSRRASHRKRREQRREQREQRRGQEGAQNFLFTSKREREMLSRV
jgi:hypothetical protein